MTTATIDCSALAHNLTLVRQHLTSPCDILAVVKADAYGHGAIPITKFLTTQGVSHFAVATLEEGLALRQSGITESIVIMGALPQDEFFEAVAHQLTPIIYSLDQATHLQEVSTSQTIRVHLKVDTGMGRLGLSVDETVSLIQTPWFKQSFQVEGIMSHLADSDSSDPTYTQEQIQRFESLLKALRANHLQVPLQHLANSSAILVHPSSHFTMVRPGIMLYGYHTLPSSHPSPELKPVLSLTSQIVQIREHPAGQRVSYNQTFTTAHPSRIAILPIGYADGVNRLLSNRGTVLIQGQHSPIVGRVCMDMIMVDVTHSKRVAVGDEAVLIGTQGQATITAADLAQVLETIPYEILCKIGPRVQRRYVPPQS